MLIDPQNQAMLDAFAEQGLKPFEEMTPAEQREGSTAFIALQGPAETVGEVVEVIIPVNGGTIAGRLYKPAGPGPYAICAYYHGGGFVFGDIDLCDPVARAMCNRSGAAFLSVGYRKAPEHKFPTAIEDAYAGLLWIAENASKFSLDLARVAVVGDSAGGGLAAGVAQMARDHGGPRLIHQLLIYPFTDASGYPPTDGTKYPSRVEKGEGYFLTSKAMAWFVEQYLENADQAMDPRASPLMGKLEGLPPTTIVSAGFDPLLSEGEAYGAALDAAGVPVEFIRNPNQIHGFFWMAATVDQARVAIDAIGDRLRRALGNG